MKDNLDTKLSNIRAKIKDFASKQAFAPTGSMPPMDPMLMGGGAPMDPAAAGGAPPMDPAAMGGAAPMPADPAAMGGAPMDPALAGGAPPMDPAAMGGMPPANPADMGVMPPAEEDPMQMLADMKDELSTVKDLLTKLCRHLDVSLDNDKGASALLGDEDKKAVADVEKEKAAAADPLSDEASAAIKDPSEQGYVAQQLQALGGGM